MDEPEEFGAYITKYALTEGIWKERVRKTTGDKMVLSTTNRAYFHEGKEWHRTFESAHARALKMRDAKIKSLERSIKRLRELTFDDPDKAS